MISFFNFLVIPLLSIFLFRPLAFPFVPARELSSMSFWRESRASRKLNPAELRPTLMLSYCFPFLDTCETDVLSDLTLFVFPPHLQKDQAPQRDHFPNHVCQRGEDPGRNAPHVKKHTHRYWWSPVLTVDGNHRWRIGLPDEDAAPHRHHRVKLPLDNCGHGHHLAGGSCGPVLPKPPEKGRNFPEFEY